MSPKQNILQLLSLLIACLLIVAIILFIKQELTATQQSVVESRTLTVEATTGLQSSHIQVKAGQKIILDPEGRIHLAFPQIVNRANLLKPFIINKSPKGTFSLNLEDRYKILPDLNDENNENYVFNRNWIDPSGEKVASDFLDECKLRPDWNWGTLLAIILPVEASSEEDPFGVLKSQNLNKNNFFQISKRGEQITADRSGWLTFIVNEAINSPDSPSKKSQVYYDALTKAQQQLSAKARHRIDSVPLAWFSDNAGTFRVTVKFKE